MKIYPGSGGVSNFYFQCQCAGASRRHVAPSVNCLQQLNGPLALSLPQHLPWPGKMTDTGRRRCRSSVFTQPTQDATATSRCAATLPRRASDPLWRCAWLGVSAAAAVTSFLSSNAEAFVHPAIGRAQRVEAHSGGQRKAGGTIMMSERRGLWPQRSTIDLRSDTVTQPTGGMRKAMHKVLK